MHEQRIGLGDLHHLVLDVDGVAGWTDVVAAHARGLELGRAGRVGRDVHGLGSDQPDLSRRRDGPPVLGDIGRHQIAGPVFGGIGVGHVLGEELLALLMPLHLRAQHGQQRNVGDGHGALAKAVRAAKSTRSGRQTLPGVWLMRG